MGACYYSYEDDAFFYLICGQGKSLRGRKIGNSFLKNFSMSFRVSPCRISAS